MRKKTALISGATALVLVLGGAGVAVAVNENGDDGRLTGETLERASNAALAEVGTGTVTSAENTNDDGATYALEVRLDNGGDVDVELNKSFDVIWVGNMDTNDDANSGAPAADPANTEAAAAAAASATSAANAANAAAAATSADARASAEAAALVAVGSGTVTEFDLSDDLDHLYEVEVTLDTGADVDVELDADFTALRLDGVAR